MHWRYLCRFVGEADPVAWYRFLPSRVLSTHVLWVHAYPRRQSCRRMVSLLEDLKEASGQWCSRGPEEGILALGTEVPTFYMDSGLHRSLPVKGGESGRHMTVLSHRRSCDEGRHWLFLEWEPSRLLTLKPGLQRHLWAPKPLTLQKPLQCVIASIKWVKSLWSCQKALFHKCRDILTWKLSRKFSSHQTSVKSHFPVYILITQTLWPSLKFYLFFGKPFLFLLITLPVSI